jgi:hypothetical protein
MEKLQEKVHHGIPPPADSTLSSQFPKGYENEEAFPLLYNGHTESYLKLS